MTEHSITEKWCPRCQKSLLVHCFTKNAYGKYGLADYCRDCCSIVKKLNYKVIRTNPPDLPDEEWRVCIADERYEVSNNARVRRAVKGIGTWVGRHCKQHLDKDGYYRVIFGGKRTGKTNHLVHRLVAIAFLDPPISSDKQQINHLNGKRDDNRLENLEWCTPRHNVLWRYETKTMLLGEHHPNAKLTDRQVRKIRKDLARGISIKSIATKLNVTYQTIHGIKTGKGWGKVV